MRAVLALYPDSSLVHATLGTILENQGELDAAARSYQQAVDLLERRADVVFLERRPQRAAMALEAWREAVLRTRVRR